MSVFTLTGAVTSADIDSYVKALLDMLGENEPVAVLRQTPQKVQELIADLSDEQLTRPEAPGKWSIRHTVQHLADSELVGANRLRMVLAHDRPPLVGYDQDLWADCLRYQEIPVQDALEQFTFLRRINLRLWSSLSEADLQRVGLHNERGEESLGHIRRLYAGHDLVHLRQIERIRRGVTA